MVTLLSASASRVSTSIAATPKCCPQVSSQTLVMAEVESTKMVYSRPRSFLCSNALSACHTANTSASKTSLFLPSWKRRPVYPPSGGLQTHAAPTAPSSCLDQSVHTVSGRSHSFAVLRASSFFSTTIRPPNRLPSSHSCLSADPPPSLPAPPPSGARGGSTLQNLLRALAPLGSGVESLCEVGPSMVEQGSGGRETALHHDKLA